MPIDYVAGKHNIGEEEARHRRLTYGWGGAIIAFAVFAILNFLNVTFWPYVIMILPIYISVSGFYQATEHFSISYAKNGLCNITGQIGETRDVIGQLNRNKDAKKARRMMIKSWFISLILVFVAAYIGTTRILT